ncbi:MAG: hypothetical protein WCP20_16810 [Desulfuromonadales bacterium]
MCAKKKIKGKASRSTQTVQQTEDLSVILAVGMMEEEYFIHRLLSLELSSFSDDLHVRLRSPIWLEFEVVNDFHELFVQSSFRQTFSPVRYGDEVAGNGCSDAFKRVGDALLALKDPRCAGFVDGFLLHHDRTKLALLELLFDLTFVSVNEDVQTLITSSLQLHMLKDVVKNGIFYIALDYQTVRNALKFMENHSNAFNTYDVFKKLRELGYSEEECFGKLLPIAETGGTAEQLLAGVFNSKDEFEAAFKTPQKRAASGTKW